MRTTLTLDADVEDMIRRSIRESGSTFKVVVNQAIRAGLGRTGGRAFTQRTFAMGRRDDVNYDKALRIAGALEDEERLSRIATGR